MKNIKITQVRSIIDHSQRQKDTIKALGLRRINASVVKQQTPQILGMIAKVKHLVTIEEC
ncbi:MAG: 50S ribosomal protein L30 [Saprospiraceae bacterium]|nr:50S ribosomal protein L30 [Saprospiraceae bacterium]MBK6565491.1 50S ribosomal protein L30 [Saprospiraceae bacterium]MBK6784029.1 50S ribosomal protein L30 [Saprospiraceae bacterium]MBK7522760.1 50S ribosomal protein L30 [Saprospiraceae bacterium]MBK8079924.1 50S ribosomal protein L30 [Saprospiraceae bacterium]